MIPRITWTRSVTAHRIAATVTIKAAASTQTAATARHKLLASHCPLTVAKRAAASRDAAQPVSDDRAQPAWPIAL